MTQKKNPISDQKGKKTNESDCPHLGLEEDMQESLSQGCLVHRLLLGSDSSMSSEGALKDAVHGTEAAQRSREGKRTRKRSTMLQRSMAYSQRTTDFRIRPDCQSWYHCFLGQVTFSSVNLTFLIYNRNNVFVVRIK